MKGVTCFLKTNVLCCVVFRPDDHYKNDDGHIKQKMELQSKQIMKLTIPEILASAE